MKLSNKGLSLPEVMLAGAILAFVLSGLMMLFIGSAFLNEANRNLSLATSHAQFVMEDIKNTDFGDIKTKIDNGDWDWNAQAVAARGLSALDSETIDTSVTGTNPLDIAVSVRWIERRTRNRSAQLETLISEP